MFPASTRILIVDDMMTMRRIVYKTCQNIGFSNMTEASDGEKAWTAMTNAPTAFQLIICDWNMPNCTGIELLKRVRADARFKHTPFVLLTAESEAAQVTEAMQAGVDNYIIKPFNGKQIQTKLEETYRKVASRIAAAGAA